MADKANRPIATILPGTRDYSRVNNAIPQMQRHRDTNVHVAYAYM